MHGHPQASVPVPILERTGFAFENGLDQTVAMLSEKGAQVDMDAHRIRFPRELIADAIAKAPSQVALYGRDKKHEMV